MLSHRFLLDAVFIALLCVCLTCSAVTTTAKKHITLANHYKSSGKSNLGDYDSLQAGPNGLPQALRLKGRTTDCWVQYHYRTEKKYWDEEADEEDADEDTPDEQKKYKVSNADGGFIPVLGVTVVKDPKLFLLRLMHSIDYPIHDIVIVAGGDNKIVGLELDHIKENFANVTIIACSHMQSVTQGWNQLLTTYMAAPWMVISAIDVEFQPGALQTFARHYWAGYSNGSIEMAYFSYLNLRFGRSHQRFNVFGMARVLLDRLGLFDENIWPAYCEDEEWELRLRILGAEFKNATFFDAVAYHGRKNLDGSSHVSGIKYFGKRAVLAKSRHLRNCMYVKLKWGCLKRYYRDCKFASPFNLTKKPITFWKYNKSPFIVPKEVDLNSKDLVSHHDQEN